jgi:hypothetical protein
VTVPAPDWKIVEYRGRAGLVRLESDWRRLYAAMPQRTGFHAYEAHLAYVDHLMKAPDRLRCLALSDGREVRAICLLEARLDRTLGAPVWVLRVPLPSHLPLGDVICPEDDARRAFVPALAEYLRRATSQTKLLVLGSAPTDGSLWANLSSMDTRQHCVNRTVSSFVFDCRKPFDELLSRLSRSFRRDLRRHRKLASLADVRFVTATTPADLAAEFETFLDVEASGWKGADGTRTAIRFRGNQPAFFRSLLTLHDSEDYCEINALYAEGHCIASELCVRTGEECAGLRMGYDERYARLSPSHLLFEHTLQRCCEDPGIRRFNMTSDSAWQSHWRPDSIPLQRVYVAIGRWSGRPLVALLRLRFGPARRLARWWRSERQRLRERRGTPRAAHAQAPPSDRKEQA